MHFQGSSLDSRIFAIYAIMFSLQNQSIKCNGSDTDVFNFMLDLLSRMNDKDKQV